MIDYVDFGPDGNAFLSYVDVRDTPTASILAQLLLDRQASFFKDTKHDNPTKVNIYTKCLLHLADIFLKTSEGISPSLTRRLENEPWCLAYQYSKTSDNRNNFSIVTPKEIYLVDDHNFASFFEPLCPPDALLNNMYKQFGSKRLSEYVTSRLTFSGMLKIDF